MSERYSVLFSLPENLYAEGAPVIVSAGNLLKDNQTGKVLAQLKIKNISKKTVKAATVLIHAQDTTGKGIDGNVEQEYLDLSVEQRGEFGQKAAVFLPNASTRGFSVEVKKVVFADNSTWETGGEAWEPLPLSEALVHRLGDTELAKQYQLHFGGKCEILPQEHKDLWVCTCGEWNRDEKCSCCGKEKSDMFSFDLATLTNEKEARLAEEKAQLEAKAAEKKAAAAAKAKKTKRAIAIMIPVVIAVILLAVFINKQRANYLQEEANKAEEREKQIVQSEIVGTYSTSYQDRSEGSVSAWTWTYMFSADGSVSMEVTEVTTYFFNSGTTTLSPTVINHFGNYYIDTENDCIIIKRSDGSPHKDMPYIIKSDGTIELMLNNHRFTKQAG